jgi:hypothetical protein
VSTNVVNKLDIDVLVHVAVYGPAGADDWRRLDDQPDESGRALWGQNWERAGYEIKDRPPIEDYTFEPLPFAITVGEAFAHLGYFRYQTAEEFGRGWYGSFAGRYEAAVRTQLEGFVEGVKEAPWGWSPRDVRDRLSRGGAPGSDQTEPDPAQDSQLAAVETAFAEGGITLTRLADPGGRRPEGLAFAPRTVIGAWEVRVGGTPEYPATGFLPALQVWLFADEEAARSTYRANLRRHQDERDSRPYGASRIGNVVILWSAFDSGHEAELLRGGLSVLGEPDEHWRGRPPQELLGPVQVGAVRALTTEGAGSGMRYMVVARTPKELERLAGFIVDDDVRQQALAIDVSRQSALLLVGVASVDPGGLVTLQERVAETPDGAFTSDETVTEMTLDLAGLTMNAASLVTVPALRRAPQTARVWGPRLKTNMPIMDA